ncbi:ABC transporter permease [Kutzneria sp. CA-103260]|uniref:ABC transporter permease n=1 Tax=Kutzneria sp. CA-103260 TaxID=2802641 RepID=UPI001BAD9E22|nr:ABC transporter permease [Kutzneria sp. CA-103260]QUQ64971.1 ABC transporter permease [Kutzneria sp. CA-103260]
MRPAFHEFVYWMRRYRHTWLGTVVISVLNPLLFLTGIGLGLGRLVDQAGGTTSGFTYLAFFAPGLLAASSMQTAFIEATRPVYEALHTTNTYRATATTPMRPGDILLGHLLFIAFRVLTTSAVFVLVMTAMGASVSRSVILLPLGATLTGLAFATPGAALAARVTGSQQLTTGFRFVIMPLYMFSGTFFSADSLPGFLPQLARLTPLWHGVELCRELSLATATASTVAVHVLYLGALTVAGALFATRSYRLQLSG